MHFLLVHCLYRMSKNNSSSKTGKNDMRCSTPVRIHSRLGLYLDLLSLSILVSEVSCCVTYATKCRFYYELFKEEMGFTSTLI